MVTKETAFSLGLKIDVWVRTCMGTFWVKEGHLKQREELEQRAGRLERVDHTEPLV